MTRHGGKCQHVHGHRYAAEVHIEGTVQADGMVLDFGRVSSAVKGWIDDQWDHAYLGAGWDEVLAYLGSSGHKVFTFDVEPTAENIAAVLLAKAQDLINQETADWYPDSRQCLLVERVVVWETPTCRAEVRRVG